MMHYKPETRTEEIRSHDDIARLQAMMGQDPIDDWYLRRMDWQTTPDGGVTGTAVFEKVFRIDQQKELP